MLVTAAVPFEQQDLAMRLDEMSDEGLDALTFGVIGFDAATIITRYNAFESKAAGLGRSRVVGKPLFDIVAPCFNNFLVALRFEEALLHSAALDVTLPYILTLRMKPVKVMLRLLARPASARRYILVQRNV